MSEMRIVELSAPTGLLGAPSLASEAEAVEALMQLWLSEYEARCFVALTQLSEETAKEIAQIADVPQSRVYDITEQLHEMGLVDIQQSDPKRYYALPVEPALKTLRQEYTAQLDRADEHLRTLEGRHFDTDGVWEIADRQDVLNRIRMHIDNATDDVYLLLAHEDLLEDEVVTALREAASTDTAIWAEAPTEAARARLHRECPAIHVAVTDFTEWSLPEPEQDLGRLLMVDGETILMSALQEGLIPNDVEESGVWGSAVGNGLVVWVQQLLDARREQITFETTDE